MLHTFVGEDEATVKELVRTPFKRYLESSADLWQVGEARLRDLPPRKKSDMLEFAFERYYQQTALMGTVESCALMTGSVASIGVDEIACLIDFGLPSPRIMEGLNIWMGCFSGPRLPPHEPSRDPADALTRRHHRLASPPPSVSLDVLAATRRASPARPASRPPGRQSLPAKIAGRIDDASLASAVARWNLDDPTVPAPRWGGGVRPADAGFRRTALSHSMDLIVGTATATSHTTMKRRHVHRSRLPQSCAHRGHPMMFNRPANIASIRFRLTASFVASCACATGAIVSVTFHRVRFAWRTRPRGVR
jgi:hypothetical protein